MKRIRLMLWQVRVRYRMWRLIRAGRKLARKVERELGPSLHPNEF